ncbi:Gp138 family membrane-puncturing spike protein [Brevibacillus thermoruber]|uniref:Gp138 family membrane-puncturing spike protein n=1 Tax=Brevibacillus thermoruber TaxID=33942 RepID=UPI0005D0EADC|nr:Gp138 family membrane-puncturing spike protein [Brevibacillus thermoruber]
MSVPVSERIKENSIEFYNTLLDKVFNSLRVSVPGIIQDFDPITQTATVQIALREHVRQENMEYAWTAIPSLQDVPIVFPRGGGYVLTFPVRPGDECLVVFSDMCIDAWFSLGGVQNQIEKRRHDLSDAIAIPGLWSQPRRLQDYSTKHVELRDESRAQFVRITEDAIDLVAPRVRVNGVNITDSEHYNSWINGGGKVDT